MREDETTNSPGTTDSSGEAPFVLPKHVRFVRSLALVSAAAVGIAAGAAVFGSGCGGDLGSQCSGPCGVYGVRAAVDAQADRPSARDAGDGLDGSVDAVAPQTPAGGRAGGGPRPAPHLPVGWFV